MFLDWLRSRREARRRRRERRRLEHEAREAEVFPEWDYVNVHFVLDGEGSYWGATEELHTDPDGPHPDWEDQLRQMLIGVTERGLSELIEPQRHEYLRALTFRQPDGEDLEVRAGYAGKADARDVHVPSYR